MSGELSFGQPSSGRSQMPTANAAGERVDLLNANEGAGMDVDDEA